jgi:hypothetical protein
MELRCFLKGFQSDIAGAKQQAPELHGSAPDLLLREREQDPASDPGQKEMEQQEREVSLIIIPVVSLRIVDDNGKKQNSAANERGQGRPGKFIQPGFPVQGMISARDGIKQYPGDRYYGNAHPEAVIEEQATVRKYHFMKQQAAGKIQNDPG